MYERSAIVLERYLERYFGFNTDNNLKQNYENYENIVKEVKRYQEIVNEEEELIKKFDEIAKEIEKIQAEEIKLSNSNQKMEELRIQLFSDLSENPKDIGKKLDKIDLETQKNNRRLGELSQEFIKSLTIFVERQKERNKSTRKRRTSESNHINFIENAKEIFNMIDAKYVKNMRDFEELDKEEIKKELNNLMIKNGKNEKIGFNKEVIKNAVETRIDIAEKESECYLSIYDRSKRLFQEVENEDVKMNKFEKTLKDTIVKLKFLEAEKEYVVAFLDNERLTVINGPKAHKKMMEEACKGFESDILQINQLYELILREILNKSTKKAYKELYNKDYLKNIEESEKDFEEEANNIKIKMGTVINSNYWRIEGIKNIYTVFQEQVSEKFEKDLSEFKIEENIFEEEKEEDIFEEKVIEKSKVEKIEEEKNEKESEKIEKEEVKRYYKKRNTKETENKEKRKKTVNNKFEIKKTEEIEDLPKAMKDMKKKKQSTSNKNSKNVKQDRAEKIVQNTRKKQVQELKNKQEKNKGLLNKFFKK